MSRLVKTVKAETVEEGSGAIASRLFPNSEFGHLDPFVLFDEYLIEPSAYFPMHPHSGFEGIQFLAEGATLYKDNLGNEGTITAGGARRFLTGLGFEHLEEPVSSVVTRGFLLWINLPRQFKTMSPSYMQLSPSEIPRRIEDGVMAATVLGEGSPFRTITPTTMLHLTMTEGSSFPLSVEEDTNSFVYLAQGSADLSGLEVEPGSGVVLADNSDYVLEALEGSEAVFVSGKRIHERIVHRGHIVK